MKSAVNLFLLGLGAFVCEIPRLDAQSSARKLVGQLLLTVTDRGIEPATLQVPAGEYQIVILNQVYVKDLDLRLDRVTGNGRAIAVQRVEKQRQKWIETIQLTPGQYLLGDPKDGKQDCRLTVTP